MNDDVVATTTNTFMIMDVTLFLPENNNAAIPAIPAIPVQVSLPSERDR